MFCLCFLGPPKLHDILHFVCSAFVIDTYSHKVSFESSLSSPNPGQKRPASKNKNKIKHLCGVRFKEKEWRKTTDDRKCGMLTGHCARVRTLLNGLKPF